MIVKYKKDIYYVEKVLQGDTSAYAYLVNKHKEMAFIIANKIVRNKEDAEEIAQDSFLKAYQAIEKFKKEAKFSTWLYRIVYNTAISKTRKKKFEFSAIEDQIINNYSVDEIVENVNQLSDEEQKMCIDNAIDKLPEEDGLLINLFYLNESSIDEISQITGLTNSNVKVKLHRIRKKLYVELQNSFKTELNVV